jgi:hypothetical protein
VPVSREPPVSGDSCVVKPAVGVSTAATTASGTAVAAVPVAGSGAELPGPAGAELPPRAGGAGRGDFGFGSLVAAFKLFARVALVAVALALEP